MGRSTSITCFICHRIVVGSYGNVVIELWYTNIFLLEKHYYAVYPYNYVNLCKIHHTVKIAMVTCSLGSSSSDG